MHLAAVKPPADLKSLLNKVVKTFMKLGVESLTPHPVAILRVDHGPQIFAWPPVWPPQFFLNFPFKFVWLTGLHNALCKNTARLHNALCKNTGHFVNSARSKLCHNS